MAPSNAQPPLDPPLFAVVVVAGLPELVEDEGAKVTVTSPFIPDAACEALPERYSYFPLTGSFTVSDAVLPGARVFVATPTHEFALSFVLGFVQILNECGSLPLFVTLNTSVGNVIRDGETVNDSSCGTPAATEIAPIEASVWPLRAAGIAAAVRTARTSGIKRERDIGELQGSWFGRGLGGARRSAAPRVIGNPQ